MKKSILVTLLFSTMLAQAAEYGNTKIVATLGPASSEPVVLKQMVEAGLDCARINMSHADSAGHRKTFATVREVEKQTGAAFPIMMDLQGPKFRVGKFAKDKISLQKDQTFQLDLNTELGDDKRVNFPHPEVYSSISNGSIILLNDGYVALEVTDAQKDKIITKVKHGTALSNNKGVNIPNTNIRISALTAKDRTDVELINELKPEFAAMSFVQRKEDILELRKILDPKIKIIAKIEMPEAMKNIDDIAAVADGLMVARGDMAVEIDEESVPINQHIILAAGRKAAKPVIVATQMLESMIENPRATRAELNDVATATLFGADAVMLSAETSVGKHPVGSIKTMASLINKAEHSKFAPGLMQFHNVATTNPLANSIVETSVNFVASPVFNTPIEALAQVSSQRKTLPILIDFSDKKQASQYSLFWGTHVFDKNKQNTAKALGIKDLVLVGYDKGDSLNVRNIDFYNTK